jgi:hypothetical protein
VRVDNPQEVLFDQAAGPGDAEATQEAGDR